jgi:hypothetical protein
LAGQRILHVTAEIAVVEEVPAILIDDERLVDRPALVVDRALYLNVPKRLLIPRLGRRRGLEPLAKCARGILGVLDHRNPRTVWWIGLGREGRRCRKHQ